MAGIMLPGRTALHLHPATSNWLAWMARVLRAMKTRRQLIEMDARMLKDIGINRAEASEEANRAPWDLGPSCMGIHDTCHTDRQRR